MKPPADRLFAAHAAAEAHLDTLRECLELEEAGGDPDWPEELRAPFDGCDACVIREVLATVVRVLFSEKGS